MNTKANDPAQRVEILDEDIEAALRDADSYVDISPQDLKALCLMAIEHARSRDMYILPIDEIMTKQVITIGKDADLHEAVRRLSENGVSGLPVTDERGKVVGVITEKDVLAVVGIHRGHTIKDLVKHLLGEPLPRRREGLKVEDYMSSPAVTITPDADIRKASALLNERGIKRLIVVDGDNSLIGIVTRADLVKALAEL